MGLAIVDAGIRSRGNQFGRASAGELRGCTTHGCLINVCWCLVGGACGGRGLKERTEVEYLVHSEWDFQGSVV